MQLINKKKSNNSISIKDKLSVAACALLQVTGATAQTDANEDWDIDTAFLYYAEGDGRVSVFEPVVSAEKEINEDEFVNIRIVYDSLTGSTPYGALPTTTAQTITNPSGKSNVTTPAGEVPLNDTFRDTRLAVSADWTVPIDRTKRITWAGNFSTEKDFTSLAASANYAQDTSDKNRTYNIAIGYTADSWNPIGGINPELEFMIDGNFDQGNKGGTDTKSTIDFNMGITQVVNQSTIMQFNLGLSNSSGYLTDPYRFISVVDSDGQLTTALDADAPANAFAYRYEKRPEKRNRTTFFWRTAHSLDEDVINFSYRYFTDDWGINAHTLDLKYRYELGGSHYLQPHVRYYTQTAADFYVNYLNAGAALPTVASADYRLSEFVGTTLGLKYGVTLSKNSEFTIRVEMLNQTYTVQDEILPEQQGLDIAPDLDAVILQVGYNFYW